MTRARESIIDLQTTPYYHCISRCVRRAFLCGEDKFSGKNFEHRREWVTERITWLTRTFAIDVSKYGDIQILSQIRGHPDLISQPS